MSFYSNVFDPKLVVGQIVSMQCLSYLSLSCLIWTFHELFGTELGLSQVFGTSTLGWETADSVAATAAVIMNGLFIGAELSIVVERAKKCLDFAVTFFFLHLVFCSVFETFPFDWRWWATNIGSCTIAAVSGEYLCMKKELREIDVNEFLSVSSFRILTIAAFLNSWTNKAFLKQMRPVRAEVPSANGTVQRRPPSSSQRSETPDLA